jgi:glutamate dehydrogenase (NADP+)
VQNRTGQYWDLDTVNNRLAAIMRREANGVFDVAEARNISLRSAAYIRGVKRICDAIADRGTSCYFASGKQQG